MEIFIKLGVMTLGEKRIVRDLENYFNKNPDRKVEFKTAITKRELISAHYHFCVENAIMTSEKKYK